MVSDLRMVREGWVTATENGGLAVIHCARYR
jgi:hypothetical protein